MFKFDDTPRNWFMFIGFGITMAVLFTLAMQFV